MFGIMGSCKRILFSATLVAALAAPLGAAADVYYLRSNAGAPWGLAGNETQMNNVFGAGNWNDARYETVSTAALFSAGTTFIFMEGGDNIYGEMLSFIAANQSAMQAWVSGGGSILINAAANEGPGSGADLGFGVTSDQDLGFTASAVNAAHPIFNGPASPVATNLTGSYFSHNSLTGTFTSLIVDDTGDTVLAEMDYGAGHAMFGGLTLPFFTSHPAWTQPDSTNLHQNLISYAADQAGQAVPVPGVLALMALGLTGLGFSRRRPA